MSDREVAGSSRLHEVVSLAMRALRQPQSGAAGVLSAAVSEAGASVGALYVVPASPERPELLAAAGRDAATLGPPGAVKEELVPYLREAVLRAGSAAHEDPGALPAPWGEYEAVAAVAARLPGERAAVLLLAGSRPLSEDHLAWTIGPLGLLASLLVSSRREEARYKELREIRQEGALLAASLQHDLRTPLTSIMGCAQTLQERGESLPEERRAELLEIIVAQSRRLHEMIEEALSRHGGGADAPVRLAPVALRELCGRVAAAGRSARGGEIVIEVGPETVVTDQPRLERALLNLLDNALKYSPADEAVHIVGERSEGWYTITVADAGPGVSAEMVSALFTPYATDPGRAGGTGLGLHSVASLVRELGGHVSYARQSGWTRFSIALPEGDAAGEGPSGSGA